MFFAPNYQLLASLQIFSNQTLSPFPTKLKQFIPFLRNVSFKTMKIPLFPEGSLLEINANFIIWPVASYFNVSNDLNKCFSHNDSIYKGSSFIPNICVHILFQN